MDKQILIIDDSSHQRQILRHQLEKNYTVIEAQNGKEGVRIFEEQRLDGVFVDLQMPFMDGRVVLQLIRAQNRTLPIVVMSSNVQDSTWQECEQLGATTFIDKPFETTHVNNACSQIFTS